jgi:hypothetical protein
MSLKDSMATPYTTEGGREIVRLRLFSDFALLAFSWMNLLEIPSSRSGRQLQHVCLKVCFMLF